MDGYATAGFRNDDSFRSVRCSRFGRDGRDDYCLIWGQSSMDPALDWYLGWDIGLDHFNTEVLR